MTVQESRELEILLAKYKAECIRIHQELLKGGDDFGYTTADLFRSILAVAAENLGPLYPEKRHLIAVVRKYA